MELLVIWWFLRVGFVVVCLIFSLFMLVGTVYFAKWIEEQIEDIDK